MLGAGAVLSSNVTGAAGAEVAKVSTGDCSEAVGTNAVLVGKVALSVVVPAVVSVVPLVVVSVVPPVVLPVGVVPVAVVPPVVPPVVVLGGVLELLPPPQEVPGASSAVAESLGETDSGSVPAIRFPAASRQSVSVTVPTIGAVALTVVVSVRLPEPESVEPPVGLIVPPVPRSPPVVLPTVVSIGSDDPPPPEPVLVPPPQSSG